MACTAPARADDFELPGLTADSGAYVRSLQAKTPAGATPAARTKAEADIEQAQRRHDNNALVTALETRVGAGQPTDDQWLLLAQTYLRKTPPDPRRALSAAWQNFSDAAAGAGEIPSLLVMADALRLLDRPAQLVTTLQAVLDRAPENAGYKQALADARRAAGLLPLRVKTEPEADPPRVCIVFIAPPSRRDDFHVQDWVRLDPPAPGAAATHEGDQICVSGLPSGATTRVILRAGMPGEDGLTLTKEAVLSVAMANRQPRVLFDSRLFVLPRTQASTLGMTTVNLSAVKLELLRMTERNIVPFTRDNTLGQPVNSWAAARIADDSGRSVWKGSADIPGWQRNRLMHTALPLPEPLTTAGPGLYALIARAGDGTPGDADEMAAVQMILRTDIAPTIWRGSDGLTVQLRGYGDAKPKVGATLHLMARNNDILAETKTDTDGVAHFGAPLLRGQAGLAPVAVQAFAADEDFATIDLTAGAFDLADRGVQGQADPGPLDAFLWTDRGIYRPGETVRLMALLRDHAGVPVDLPAHITIRRPNGQPFLEANPPRGGDASLALPITLSTTAPAGMWTAELRAEPDAAKPIGSVQFRVDAFVPDRMAVDLGPVHGPIVPGTPYDLPVVARFLYGAPGAGLSGKASMRLVTDDEPFPRLKGYHIGLVGEVYAPDNQDLDLPDTGTDGHASLTIAIPRAPDTTHPLKAEIDVTVNDPSGHGSRAALTVPLRAPGHLIGIKPLFADDAVDAGTEAAFDFIAVDPAGNPTPLHGRLRLVRERPDWRLVMNGQLARYETVYRDEPIETSDVTITPDKPLHYAKSLDFGRYRLEVQEAGGLAATSVRFRSGWTSSNSPDVPDKADVSADRRAYKPGEIAHIHVTSPFAGEATVLVAGDRVFSLRNFSIPAAGRDIDVPVDAAWGPGAYALVHVFHPGGAVANAAPERPGRAIGVAWLGIDPATRKLDVAITAPDRITPRQRITVPVKTAPGAWLTLAAVDEGVLRLTNFTSPDPAPHFLGRRLLSVDIRDDWGRLILPADGTATMLSQGGDEGSFVLPEIPQKIVSLFVPPVQAGPDGMVQVPLEIPDFAGQVRLMVVAWQGNRIGSAATDMIVRDPLVAEPLLPRFLAPGDQTRLAILLHNLDLPAGAATVDITTDGPLQVSGPAHISVDLAQGAQSVPTAQLSATGAGRGIIHLDVNGPAGFHVRRDTAILVRPARPAQSFVAGGELAPGATLTFSPGADRFVAGSWSATATFGAPVRYDPAALVRALVAYPLDCLEQATSRGLPLAFLPDGPIAGDDRAGRLQRSVESVLDRQRFDGGFALWGASGEAEQWLSSYAVDFLTRARAAGAAVPDTVMKDALKFLSEASDNAEGSEDDAKPEDTAAEVYRLYDLARAGQGRPGYARVLAERMDHLPTPLARAQLGAALAPAHDRPRAEAAFAAALDAPARKWWYADYGTALRDQAATVVLLKESGLLPDRLARLVASLPGANLAPGDLATQDQAWAASAAAVLGRDAKPTQMAIDGQIQPRVSVLTVAVARNLQAHNLADQAVWQSFTASGVPLVAPPAARSQMRVTRKFLNLDGSALDLDHLRQNTMFVLLLEGRAEDGQDHQAMVLQGLPAGWEIAGRFTDGKVPGMDWLGELSATDAQPAGDDRYGAVLSLTADGQNFRVAVKLRAVTPGSYELPGAEVSDMYRPAVFARQGSNRVSVLAP